MILVQDDYELLAAMLQVQDRQKAIYQPGRYWESYKRRITSALYENKLSGFRSNSRIGKGYADTLEIDPSYKMGDNWKGRIYQSLLKSHLAKRYLFRPFQDLITHHSNEAKVYRTLYEKEKLEEWFIKFRERFVLPDTLIEEPGRVSILAGQKIGYSYLKAFLGIHNYAQKVDFTQSRVAFEIGGGFGAMCHTLLELFPNIRKFVYLDIPPVLYVGTQYLKSIYGNSVKDFLATSEKNKLKFSEDDSLEIFAIAPWQIEKLDAKVDLFWNSFSMQEMDIETVRNYCQHLSRLLNKELYNACFLMYNTPSERTIPSHKITKLIEENSCLDLTQITQDLDLYSNPVRTYVLGQNL